MLCRFFLGWSLIALVCAGSWAAQELRISQIDHARLKSSLLKGEFASLRAIVTKYFEDRSASQPGTGMVRLSREEYTLLSYLQWLSALSTPSSSLYVWTRDLNDRQAASYLEAWSTDLALGAPQNALAMMNLGVVRDRLKGAVASSANTEENDAHFLASTAQAVEHLRAAIRLNSSLAVAHYFLAATMHHANVTHNGEYDIQEIDREFSLATKLDPRFLRWAVGSRSQSEAEVMKGSGCGIMSLQDARGVLGPDVTVALDRRAGNNLICTYVAPGERRLSATVGIDLLGAGHNLQGLRDLRQRHGASEEVGLGGQAISYTKSPHMKGAHIHLVEGSRFFSLSCDSCSDGDLPLLRLVIRRMLSSQQ